MRNFLALLSLIFLLATGPALAAVSPDELLQDPEQESRARALAKELRCLVCQNQSIDDSDAPLAADLRRIVREQIVAGASDREIKSYLTDRYGDFVLLAPPVKPATYALWTLPFILFVIGAAGIAVFVRRNRTVALEADTSLSDDERRELETILKN